MSIPVATISPNELHALQRQNKDIKIIDVRSPGEYRSGHIKGAKLLTLEELRPESINAQLNGQRRNPEQDIYLTCQSGFRASQAAQRLASAGFNGAKVVEGGTQAWEKAGLPIKRCGSMISIERQVQITVGSLIVLKVLFGFTVHELFFALAALIGSGLIVAGLTRWYGMAQLIARLPWNRGEGCTDEPNVTPNFVEINRSAS